MKNLEVKNGYYMELAIGGHYRLMKNDEFGNPVYVAEDPACEDMYDEDNARAIWESRIDDGEFDK